MPTFGFSPSAGCKISVTIVAAVTEIKGAEGIPEFGMEKGTYETTSISDTAKTFGNDLGDPGEITLTGIADTTDPGQAYLLAQSAPGVNAVDVLTVDFTKKAGGTTAAKAVFSGLILSYKIGATKGGPQKFTSKVKLTGPVTWTAAV